MNLTLNLPDKMHAAVMKRVRDLGFKNLSAYLRWKLDEDLTIDAHKAKERVRLNPRNKGHKTYNEGSIRSRVEDMREGQPFTVDDIMRQDEDRASVGVTLHYLKRDGFIHLRRQARRGPDGWEPAVFVRVA